MAPVEGSILVAQQSVNQANSQTQWRMTKDGWVDLSKWNRPEPSRVEHRIELVHPLLFAAILLLSSAAVMIWASEEFHWARFFEHKKL